MEELWEAICNLFNPQWVLRMNDSLANFRTRLNQSIPHVIRMYVADSKGMGHQGSTVAVMRQLAAATGEPARGFGFTGTIDMYYLPEDVDHVPTITKLRQLMPELGTDATTCHVGLATVNVIEWNGVAAPQGQVEFGITGGVDLDPPLLVQIPNLATRLDTRRFLAIQPYRWYKPEELQAPATAPFARGRQRIELSAQRSMGTTSFKQRAYFLPTPAQPVYVQDSPYFLVSSIVGYLTAPATNIDLAAVYGIRSENGALENPAVDRMFQVIAAALASQRLPGGGFDPGARTIVLLSCDNFGTAADREQLGNLLDGGLTRDEDLEADDGDDPGPDAEQRRQWLVSVLAPEHVWTLWNPQTVAAVRDTVDEAKLAGPGNVVLIQIGPLPPPLFAWAMASSAWPSVFEGQGTANNALNIARPYFHVARIDEQGVQYPTDIIGYGVPPEQSWWRQLLGFAAPVPRRIQDAANQINESLSHWPAVRAQQPPQIAGAMVRAYRDENTVIGALHRYYASVRNYYRVTANDKLRLASAFTQYIEAGGRFVPAAGAESPLDQTWRDLNDHLYANGRLDIAPGAFETGGIYDLYTAIFGPSGLYLTGAELVKIPDDGSPLVEIAATGTAHFLGVALDATVRFTAPDGIVIADGHYTLAERWAVTEIPWLALEAPFISFSTPDSDLPPSGAVGGRLGGAGAGAELSFRLPTAEGSWQLVGEFASPLSISTFYQLAGGVDLLRALPEPFASLSGFGVRDLELVYDQTPPGAVAYMGFRLTTTTELTLPGSIKLNGITAQVTVLAPGDLENRTTDWTVAGTFTLGREPDQGTIQISATGPDLLLTGSLVAGVLSLREVVNAFVPGLPLGQGNDNQVITEFQCEFAPDTGDYSATCSMNIGWAVPATGTPVFTIESLQLATTGTSLSTTGQLIGYVTIDPTGAAFQLAVYGSYATKPGWTFRVVQVPDTEFNLSTLINQFLPDGWRLPDSYDMPVADLGLTVAYTEGSWDFSGRTAGHWTVPFIDDLSVYAELALGYQAVATDELPAGYHARLYTQWTWHNIDIEVYASYDSTTIQYGIVWGGLSGRVIQKVSGGPWTATLTFTSDTTIGSMIETMVYWVTGSRFALEAPWSVLNTIGVGGLSLEYTFTPNQTAGNTVSFQIDIGPAELGFCRVDGIEVVYDDQAAQKVKVTLKGSFPWKTAAAGADDAGDDSTLGPWDASAPGAAPAAPGTGNEYLDLRLLALGQHVTVPGLAAVQSVPAAIDLMAERLPDTDPGKIPEVDFVPSSAWIAGADMGVLRFGEDGDDESGYLLTVQTVFNDPALYALRLALAGPAAKIFAGLDFQVMYRQVSNTVGVYQAELVLPDKMRRLSIGACTLTLPTAAVSVYTNGDFQVDVGFPWNGDFTRSFTIEGVIAPGIPVTGAAGFYFGRLSSDTTDAVPLALNGTFSPVIVFGLGMNMGFGKSLQYGPLKAGFSVTADGVVEGVLATFNPYAPTTGGDPAQVQDGYYFWLRGTAGISGRLYGSVDFSVVKAEVDVSFSVRLQVTYESYVSVSVTVIVSVDVSASISIDVGLFSIRLSFSFSLRIQETFVIENGGDPPWITAGESATAHSLAGPANRRQLHRRALSEGTVQAAADPNRWGRLQPGAGAPRALKAWLGLGLTIAHDEYDANIAAPDSYRNQVACYVLMPLIETVQADEGTLDEVLAANAAADNDVSFEILAKMVLRWAITAVQPGNITPELLDLRTVTEADLAYLLDVVLVSRAGDQVPIGPADIESFMNAQFRLQLRQVPGGTTPQSASCTAFPMPPGVRIGCKGAQGIPAYNYTLQDYNSLTDPIVQSLRNYFNQVAVQVSDQPAAAGAGRPAADAGPLSMGQWMQSDYFLLLARQMTQCALDALRDFKYVINSTSVPENVVKDVNDTGGLTGGDRLSVSGLFTANAGRALATGTTLEIAAGADVLPGDSLEKLADRTGPPATATTLAMANADDPLFLKTGARIVYGTTDHVVAAGDTLISIAADVFKARFADLLSGSPGLLTNPGLLAENRTALAPLITCRARNDSTFTTLAASPAYRTGTLPGMTATQLARRNAAAQILRTGETVSYSGTLPPYVVQPGDCLADVALHFGVDLTELLAKPGVLTQQRLLADGAVLFLPPVTLKVQDGETLSSIATRTVTTAGTLGTWPYNAAAAGLFAAGAAGTSAAWIDIPHLVKYQVGAIIAEIQRTLGIRQLSRMTGRYNLHGTRLPTGGIIPKTQGMWVTSGPKSLVLPPMAGLFALTGQQVPVPDVNTTGQQYVVTLDPPPTPTWVTFPAEPMTLYLTPGGHDANRVSAALKAATGAPFAIPLPVLGAGSIVSITPASFPLTSAQPWVAASPVPLPYGDIKPSQVQDLRIRALPDALISLPDPTLPGGGAPRFAVRLATYDEATGATTTADVPTHGWATVVSFTIRRVPPVAGSPATEDTYEILGAGGADAALLERVVAQVGADDLAFNRLVLAYPAVSTGPDAAGLQTDHQPGVTFGISQVNLSTQTRPPQPGAAAQPRTAEDSALLLNTRPAFIRLLWEASITRGGGFFLYYHDGTNGRGLPDRLFNDRGEAQVSLIMLYETDRVHNYMTSVVTGVSADTTQGVVIAEASPGGAPVSSGSGLSLAQIAERTFSDVADLATANATKKLSPAAPLVISEAIYQAPPGGAVTANVAAGYGVSTGELDTANPQWTNGLPAMLPGLTAIFLPRLTVMGGGPNTTDLATTARYYRVNLTALAHDNAAQGGLFEAGQDIIVTGGPMVRSATVATGAAVVMASRAKPDPVPLYPSAPLYGSLQLQNNFSLLGYQVLANKFYRGSNAGLPAGPAAPPPPAGVAQNPDKVRVPEASTAWEYRQAIPASQYSLAAISPPVTSLPGPQDSPYRGVGTILQTDYQWLDYYGNTLITTLDTAGDWPQPWNRPPQLTGYTDPVTGLGRWPSVSASWRVAGAPGSALFELALGFDPTPYLGLYRADADGTGTVVTALFTDPLAAGPASDPVSYRVVRADAQAPPVAVAGATVSDDGRTVVLTLSRSLARDHVYLLTVAGLPGAQGAVTYSGSATFPAAGSSAAHSSSLAERAARDLVVYTTLWYQLTDPLGMSKTLTTTLLPEPVSLAGPAWDGVSGWLFTDQRSVYAYLADRAAGRVAKLRRPRGIR